MAVEHSYGTFEYGEDSKSDNMPDVERVGSHDESVQLSPVEIAMRPLVDQAPSDAGSVHSEHSYESAQAGVKRLEAISTTWSKSDLSIAYLG